MSTIMGRKLNCQRFVVVFYIGVIHGYFTYNKCQYKFPSNFFTPAKVTHPKVNSLKHNKLDQKPIVWALLRTYFVRFIR